MFVDEAKIFVRGGKGGDGCMSFRREKFVPRGGPDGGNGGKGGDVVMRADSSLHTLLDLRYQTHNAAERGRHGKGKDMAGRRGDDRLIRVPVGTVCRDAESDTVLWDFQSQGERFVVARGGRGGRGNASFATSINRAPRQTTQGAPGEERWLRVELKLLADVGLLGFPNAGKSTLISRLSAATPKIAPYPFTTLTPNLGVVALPDYASCVMADIPGLVPDAHKGKGLGLEFLRHIDRTRVLVHLLDLGVREEGRTPWEDYLSINHELECFRPHLARRPQIVVASKMDLPDAQRCLPEMERQFAAQGLGVIPISAVTGAGLDALVYRLAAELKAAAPAVESDVP